MSSHYRLDARSEEIAGILAADAGRDAWAGGYVAPGKFAPVVVRHQKTGRRVLRPMHMGFPPPGYSAEAAIATGQTPRWVARVRNLQSPFWIGNLRHTELRCLIPATAVPVWSSAIDPQTGKKRQHWLRPKGEEIFAMAGIWRDLTDMPVFAVLTVDAAGDAAEINPDAAMPVILAPDDCRCWLTAEWREAQELVKSYAGRLESTAAIGSG